MATQAHSAIAPTRQPASKKVLKSVNFQFEKLRRFCMFHFCGNIETIHAYADAAFGKTRVTRLLKTLARYGYITIADDRFQFNHDRT